MAVRLLNTYSVNGRSAINKNPSVMQQTGSMYAKPMDALATVDGTCGKTQRVLERYSCGSVPYAEGQEDYAEEYRTFEDPVRELWRPSGSRDVSPQLRERISQLAQELPRFEDVKAALFREARQAGHLSTCIDKGLGDDTSGRPVDSKGSAGFDGVSVQWFRFQPSEKDLSLVHTQHCLGGYAGQVPTDEIFPGTEAELLYTPNPKQDSGIDWLAQADSKLKGREANLEQDAVWVARWSLDIKARINAIVVELFGEEKALPELKPKRFRVEKDEGGWGGWK